MVLCVDPIFTFLFGVEDFLFTLLLFYSDALGASAIYQCIFPQSWDAFTCKSYAIGLYVLGRLFSDLFLSAHS